MLIESDSAFTKMLQSCDKNKMLCGSNPFLQWNFSLFHYDNNSNCFIIYTNYKIKNGIKAPENTESLRIIFFVRQIEINNKILYNMAVKTFSGK